MYRPFRFTAWAALMILAAFASAVFAGTTGQIKGKVVDQKGEPIIQAKVWLERESEKPDAQRQGTLTDFEGEYIISSVAPGKVVVVCEGGMGFGTQKKEISVVQDQYYTVDFELGAEAVADIEIVKTSKSQDKIIKEHDSGDTTIITSDEVDRLPVQGQSFQSLLETQVPGIVADATGSNPHVKGGRDDEMLWMLDGFNSRDPVTGTFGQNLNLNSIESISVSTGGFNAEYGKAMSGMVNVVTKSGGDDFHGNVAVDYQNSEAAEAIFGKYERHLVRPFQTSAQSAQYQAYPMLPLYDPAKAVEVPTYSSERVHPEFSFEGPIVPGKLTFFASMDYLNSKNHFSWQRAQRTWEGYNANLKLSYRLDAANKFVLDIRPGRADIGLDERSIEEGHNRTQTQDTISTNLSYTHIINDRSSFEFRYQYWTQTFQTSAKDKPGDQWPLETIEVFALPSGSNDIFEQLQRYYGPGIRSMEDLDRYEVYLAGDDLFWYKRLVNQNAIGFTFASVVGKDHNMRFGFDFQDVNFNNQIVYTGARIYRYFLDGWLDDTPDNPRDNNPLTAVNRGAITATIEYRREANLPGQGDPDSDFHKIKTTQQSYAGFLQDEWHVFPSLTLNYGLRFDILRVNVPKTRDFPEYPDATSSPILPPAVGISSIANPSRRLDVFTTDLSPRLGLSYLPNDKTKLFMNYGLFYNSTTLFNIMINDEQNSFQTRVLGQRWEWNRYTPQPLKSERTTHFQLGVDREVNDDLGFSVHASFKDTSNLLTVVDLGEGGAGVNGVNTTESIGNAKFWGVDFIFRKNLSQHWSMRFSYTYSQAFGNLDYYDYLYLAGSLSSVPNRGELYPLDWDVPHVVKLSGLYELPWNFDVSSVISYQSGYPYTKARRDIFAGRITQAFTTGRNKARMPDRNFVDITLAKRFDFTTRYTLKLYTTVYNLFNNRNVTEVLQDTGQVISEDNRRLLEFGMDFKF